MSYEDEIEKKFIAIRFEARKIAKNHGLTDERTLQAEWTKFVVPFRALGPVKVRWYEEWAKHCAAVKQPYRGINSDEELRECL